MRQQIQGILLCAALAGCATPGSVSRGAYGNFVAQPFSPYNQQLAKDALVQLTEVYPPASTRFKLQQPIPDAFGAALAVSLRGRGYALRENPRSIMRQSTDAVERPLASAPIGASAQESEGIPMRYVLDLAAAPNLYRLTLFLGDQSLSRAYWTKEGMLHPAGAWVRKESQP